MTYLVTGGAGFIGSTFVKHLLKEHPSEGVIVLDALTYAGNLDNLKDHIRMDNVIMPREQRELSIVRFDEKGSPAGPAARSKGADLRARKLKGRPHSFVDNGSLGKEASKVLESAGPEPGMVFVCGNIADAGIVSELVPIADHVVNFAAETHVDRSIMDPDEFIKTDVYGTYVLLESARASGLLKRFVHISTDEVYGVATDRGFTEKDPMNPRNPYSASKAAADRMVYAYSETYGLPVNIVRPSNNFGPYQYPEKLVPLMVLKALRNEPLPVYGDGKQVRDWLHVRDTARAVDMVLHSSRPGEVYNIAGRNERENIEVVKAILLKLDRPASLIKHVEDRPGHDRRYSLDDTKVREDLGYAPSGEFVSDLSRTVQWYIDNEWWWSRIMSEDREYRDFMERWYRERR